MGITLHLVQWEPEPRVGSCYGCCQRTQGLLSAGRYGLVRRLLGMNHIIAAHVQAQWAQCAEASRLHRVGAAENLSSSGNRTLASAVTTVAVTALGVCFPQGGKDSCVAYSVALPGCWPDPQRLLLA